MISFSLRPKLSPQIVLVVVEESSERRLKLENVLRRAAEGQSLSDKDPANSRQPMGGDPLWYHLWHDRNLEHREYILNVE